MVASVLLNLIYLFFPLLCYFIYIVYSKATYEKEKMIFFDLALFSSFYFCARFGELSFISAIFLNVPILLSLYKKRVGPAIVLSVGISFILSRFYEINFFIMTVQYVLMFILGFFTKFKINNIFMMVKFPFWLLIVIFFPNRMININNFWFVLVFWILLYLVIYVIISFFNKIEVIVKMYNSLKDISREKKLYESLFKITHEIKNPLAVCKGYLDMFDINNPSKASRYAGIINQEIDRTLLLLKDFSDISKLKIDKSPIDISMLLEDVCDEAKLILKNNIVFKYKISDDEVYINGDYNRLKQVFINVVKNAKEAIEKKGEVTLKARPFNNTYVITIKDNGIGMSKEDENKIGTAFYTTKKNGTGLGVCFSKEIIAKHDGTMKYISKEGKGTSVIITLPINKTSVS